MLDLTSGILEGFLDGVGGTNLTATVGPQKESVG